MCVELKCLFKMTLEVLRALLLVLDFMNNR